MSTASHPSLKLERPHRQPLFEFLLSLTTDLIMYLFGLSFQAKLITQLIKFHDLQDIYEKINATLLH